MQLTEREFFLPRNEGGGHLLEHFASAVRDRCSGSEMAVRFAVTETTASKYHCEVGVLGDVDESGIRDVDPLFGFRPRNRENSSDFNVVLIVPTGIGAEIGGHAGDAGPVARMIAASCDNLITHPNVVNASDINELPENGLYVEGSVISRLLMGTVGLQRVRANRVMLVVDKHREPRIADITVNAVSAARAALGLDCPIVVEMEPSIGMRAQYATSGRAVGVVVSVERVCRVFEKYDGQYDAVALASVIDVPSEFHTQYFKSEGEMVNPWGGVEAIFTHALTQLFDVPTAHSPMFESMEIANLSVGRVDPRMSAETVSNSFLHCILKGLHRSPRIVTESSDFGNAGILSAADVSCLVIPDGCIGLPTMAAMRQDIPVIAVRENRNRMKNDLCEFPFKPGKLFIVDNYLEAVGIVAALRGGVAPSAVRRPLAQTTVICEQTEHGHV